MLHTIQPAYDEELLRQWLLEGNIRNEGANARLLLPDTHRCIILMLHPCHDTDDKTKRHSLTQDVASCFLDLGPTICFRWQENNRIVVLGLNQEYLHTETTRGISSSFNIIQGEFGYPIAAGVSSIQTMNRNGLVAGVEQAQLALAGLFYDPEQELYYYNEVAYRLANKLQYYPQREDEIFQIQTSDQDIQVIIDNWLTKLTGERWVRPDILLNAIYNSLLQYQQDLSQRFSLETNPGNNLFSLANDILMCECRNEAVTILCRYFSEIRDFISTFVKSRHTLVMEECLMQLEQAYLADITLTSVASQYHFSPSYFSLLFKQYTGKSFIHYMTDLRIRQASRLLETTSLKVYEIAQKVGFHDVKYFSRLFRKKQRVTPEEYRQLGSAAKHRLD